MRRGIGRRFVLATVLASPVVGEQAVGVLASVARAAQQSACSETKLDVVEGQVQVITDCIALRGLSVDEEWLYWSSDGAIFRMSKKGAAVEPIASVKGLGRLLAADSGGVYATACPPGPSGCGPHELAVRLLRLRPGGRKAKLIANDLPAPSKISADRGFVYWSVLGYGRGTGGLFRAESDGKHARRLSGPETNVWDFAFGGDRIYWVSDGDGPSDAAIRSVGNAGGAITTIARPPRLSSHVAVDATHIYWVELRRYSTELKKGEAWNDAEQFQLMRATTEGAGITAVANPGGDVERLLSHGEHLLWVSADGSVRRMKKSDSSVTTLVRPYSNAGSLRSGWDLQVDDRALYLGRTDDVAGFVARISK